MKKRAKTYIVALTIILSIFLIVIVLNGITQRDDRYMIYGEHNGVPVSKPVMLSYKFENNIYRGDTNVIVKEKDGYDSTIFCIYYDDPSADDVIRGFDTIYKIIKIK